VTSSFAGLSTALSALYAQRRGLDVTGQNIANANTDGYTRQRVNMESVGAPAVPALWSNYTGAGSGVTVTDVQRLRDSFLESRGRTEQGALSQLTGRQATLAGIEGSFQEPGDTGLQSQLSDLWSAWHDVATHPGDPAARTQLLSTTATMADGIRATYSSLDAQWTAGQEQLGTTVEAVNATARNVAELNQAILTASQSGIQSNELIDKRDVLVMNLAQLTGAQARTESNGSVDVLLGGIALVRGSSSAALSVTGARTMDDFRTGVAGPATVTWSTPTGAVGAIAEVGGETGARVEALGTTLPDYADKLDAVVANLRDTVNAAHTTGSYDLNGDPGQNMFDPAATAKNITSLLTDPRKVAASKEAPRLAADGVTLVPSLDGSNAAALAGIGELATGPDATYRQLVVQLGAAAQTSTRRLEIQASVAGDIDAARESQAGVNIDEEMVNLLSFQRAYESAARVISTVDATLDTLINRTGLVGR
jgi:flagellar hook-associated protein 1 FlgK